LKGHKEPVRSIAFSPDGRRIISGGLDRTLKLWEGGEAPGTV
jgi:WD40 repeat protein